MTRSFVTNASEKYFCFGEINAKLGENGHIHRNLAGLQVKRRKKGGHWLVLSFIPGLDDGLGTVPHAENGTWNAIEVGPSPIRDSRESEFEATKRGIELRRPYLRP